MASRLQLHDELVTVLGSRNVYFQPPESVKMKYPCIVYHRANIDVDYADDQVYKKVNQYQVMVIDPNPDSTIADALLEKFKMISFNNHYTADNLYHEVLTLYY